MAEAEFEMSPLLPPGWSIKAMVQLGKTFLRSPDGKVMQGKLMAIRQMRKERYPEEHVEMMVNSLSQDGWGLDDNLPAGWRFKKSKKGFSFLTEMQDQMDSLSQAQTFIEKKFGTNEAEQFKSFIKQQSEVYLEDEYLPAGWKSKKGNFAKPFYISPTGESFNSRIMALKSMVEQGGSLEEVAQMREGLVTEGWVEDRRLPMQWRMKMIHGSQTFLTPQADTLTARKALELLVSEGSSKDDIALFKSAAGIEETYMEDNYLPKGWKAKKGNFGKTVFESPTGETFTTRRLAVRFMVEQGSSCEEVDRMVEGLEQEGWLEDTRIPRGWRIKETVAVEKGKERKKVAFLREDIGEKKCLFYGFFP